MGHDPEQPRKRLPGPHPRRARRQPRASHPGLAYHSALRVFTPETDPFRALTTARNLGNAAFDNQRWNLAFNAFQLAIDAVEQARDQALSEHRKRQILAEAISVYTRMVETCIADGRLRDALEFAERSKARTLAINSRIPKGLER